MVDIFNSPENNSQEVKHPQPFESEWADMVSELLNWYVKRVQRHRK